MATHRCLGFWASLLTDRNYLPGRADGWIFIQISVWGITLFRRWFFPGVNILKKYLTKPSQIEQKMSDERLAGRFLMVRITTDGFMNTLNACRWTVVIVRCCQWKVSYFGADIGLHQNNDFWIMTFERLAFTVCKGQGKRMPYIQKPFSHHSEHWKWNESIQHEKIKFWNAVNLIEGGSTQRR